MSWPWRMRLLNCRRIRSRSCRLPFDAAAVFRRLFAPVLLLCAVYLTGSLMIVFLPTLAEPQHFSLAEKLLFAGLALASGYAFWRRFGVVQIGRASCRERV